MGFIDRSDDIVVDAVLTDLGRLKMARGDFRVIGYAFGDDEIDYSYFNPSAGSSDVDRDILDIPIFEANVNERLSLNYPLITITNPYLKYLPSLKSDNYSISIGEEKGLSSGISARFYQDTSQNAKIVPVEIQDSAFKIEVNHDFLYIEDETPVDITPTGTAIYLIQRDSQLIQSTQGSQVSFRIRPQSITNTAWDIHGVGSAPSRTISTKVKATGVNSGLSSVISVSINEEFKRV
jgi:hypothetical protein